MESIREQLERSWEILGSLGDERNTRVRQLTSLHARHGSILLGLDEQDRRHLLFPISPKDARIARTGARGIRLGRRNYVDDGRVIAHLDLECSVPRLERLFTIVVADLLERVGGVEDDVGELLAGLAEWKHLLERADAEVDVAAVRGAFGELWQLRALCAEHPAAGGWWSGPRRMPRDIEGPGGSIEVKSSSRSVHTVQINGLGQLASAPDEPLFLVVQLVREDPRGEDLASLVASMAKLGADTVALLDGLAMLGIDPDDDAVRTLSFVVQEEAFYEVRDGFPRLVPADLVAGALHRGVDKLTYRIDLTACAEFLTDSARARSIVGGHG